MAKKTLADAIATQARLSEDDLQERAEMRGDGRLPIDDCYCDEIWPYECLFCIRVREGESSDG